MYTSDWRRIGTPGTRPCCRRSTTAGLGPIPGIRGQTTSEHGRQAAKQTTLSRPTRLYGGLDRAILARRAHSAAHLQFAASASSPAPVYFGSCGYGQTGRVNDFAELCGVPAGAGGCVPRIVAGGLPVASHASSAPSQSTANAPSPPAQ